MRAVRSFLALASLGIACARTGTPVAEPNVRVRVPTVAEPAPSAAVPREGTLPAAESDSASRQLARHVDFVARWHELSVRPALRFRPDRYLRGGDHLAFAEQGFAAVRFTEMAERYERQHQDVRSEAGRSWGDLPEHVDAHYLAGVARLQAAAVAHLANAPSPPSEVRVVAAELTADTYRSPVAFAGPGKS